MAYFIRIPLSGSAAEEGVSQSRPAVAGLAAAALISILLFKIWPLETMGLAGAFSQALDPAVTALIVSAGTVLVSFLAGMSAAFAVARGMSRVFLEAAALGAWAGPVAVLATGREPLLLFAAPLLAPATARLLRAAESDSDDRRMFDLLAAGDGGLVRAVAGAVALQLSVIAAGSKEFAIASLLICGALAALSRVAWRRRSSGPAPRYAGLLAGAILFAVLAIVPLVGGGGGSRRQASQPRNEQAATNVGGDHNGLYLFPKAERTVVLVPPPPSLRSELLSSRKDNPLRVPFFGIYWVFREPEVEPPRASFRGEGDPEGMNLRSMDGRPIRVEARQNFGRVIDLRCCSEIMVQVRNNDRYPGTVRMELLLRDSRNNSMVSLGGRELRSTQRFRLYDSRTAVNESVEYAVPGGTAPFDEAVIRFHLEKGRERRAAKIAVEAFVFVPRL